ncbi:MAG: aminodeoxychorismate/anthranilate synthase component II [Phycisphaerae bacterium]|jgi:anthranilate synthase/aminodeoxychorismate synthase-like glutamine amidotransferase|nr:aminodeoxychorismate/anthranilate synthase component II [Phycisphaerae bacterium]|tara:strand:- start:334 stop:924 length:591 start_codon:yes stop_codon:yes gene_type:complete
MLLIVDNYDSFTYNLVQRIGEIGLEQGSVPEMKVIRNDEMTVSEVEALAPDRLLLSPGPCTPDKSGICRELVSVFRGNIPILGVCLGHQAIADLHGMNVKQYDFPVHGKTSEIHHDNKGVFTGLPQPFMATRYHSLVVEPESIAKEFVQSAWTDDGVCMGIRWTGNGSSLEGVQFHPESFMTDAGPALLANFLQQV